MHGGCSASTGSGSLALTARWDIEAVFRTFKDEKDRQQQRKEYLAREAAKDFLKHFGDKSDDLAAWRSLCWTMGVDKSFLATVAECEESLEGVFVNIYDLIDAANAGRITSPIFSTAEELAKYTAGEHKFYPYREALGNDFFKRFLVRVHYLAAGGTQVPRRKRKDPPTDEVRVSRKMRQTNVGLLEIIRSERGSVTRLIKK
ncbi:hypothetical protein C8J56DRAFT_793084 [Mycena floridula]|nr:hypothetical protein C8J56DRAFT_806230 [Mycena floridula]KAJ7581966.1 hypothetical protein C8J56DRAFT_793084 [Mycena floridula]